MAIASRGRREPARQPLPGESGFTLVELLVAIFVLLVGMLGVLALLTGALRTTSKTNARVGATNLARELVESARGLDYDDLTSTLVRTRLQAEGLGSGTPWTIARRGTTYTVTATTCTFDDPTDNLASPPPTGVCTPQPTGATGDTNGEDFRRVSFALAWTENGGAARSIAQTTLIVNPSGGLGPRIVSFSPVSLPIYDAAVTTATVNWTTTAATTFRWVVDDGTSAGSSTGSTSFTTTWNLGTTGSGTEVLDGAYEISGQPYDDRDIAGEAKRANVDLNRRKPYAPTGFAGGHDLRVSDWVDLQWSQNPERDILGYKVFWAGPDNTIGNGNDTQVCPAPAAGAMLDKTVTSCADLSPPSGATTYYVLAVDRYPNVGLASDGTPRDGDTRTLAVAAPGARPNPPAGPLTVTTVNGQPKLTWAAPATGGVSFYRIYRDGASVGYADRYSRTSATTFTDDNSGAVAHQYRVTAVDSTFNESDPLGPVTSTP
jgi:prepilin-type N-terminal cleavage/methylation domain-containing protein